jgi:DNA-binding LacI/PurR family transcriptional regulator
MASLVTNTEQAATSQRVKKSLPIHKQLYQILRGPIMSGAYRSGTKLPTETELTEIHGVSRITVRRALQELAAEGLVEGRQGQGTFVRSGASIIAKPRYLLIDSDISSVTYPYTQMILKGLQGGSRNTGFRLEIFVKTHGQEYSARDAMASDLIESADFDGVIALSGCLKSAEAQRLEKRDIPIVLVGHMYETFTLGPKVVNVDCDGKLALFKLLTHLLQAGYHKIGYIGKPLSEYEPHKELISSTFADAGLEFDPNCYEPSDYGVNPATQACCRLLKKHPDLRAVVTNDDLQAVGALQYLRSVGKNIPQEVAVAGMGNFLDEHSHFEITTVDVRITEQGRTAVNCLEDLIAGKHVEKHILLEPLLIRRKTT